MANAPVYSRELRAEWLAGVNFTRNGSDRGRAVYNVVREVQPADGPFRLLRLVKYSDGDSGWTIERWVTDEERKAAKRWRPNWEALTYRSLDKECTYAGLPLDSARAIAARELKGMPMPARIVTDYNSSEPLKREQPAMPGIDGAEVYRRLMPCLVCTPDWIARMADRDVTDVTYSGCGADLLAESRSHKRKGELTIGTMFTSREFTPGADATGDRSQSEDREPQSMAKSNRKPATAQPARPKRERKSTRPAVVEPEHEHIGTDAVNTVDVAAEDTQAAQDAALETRTGADTPEAIERNTAAPEDYDGFGTGTVEWLPFRNPSGRQWRRVRILAEHYEWQTSRYASGMFGSHDPADDLLEYLARSGSVQRIGAESPAEPTPEPPAADEPASEPAAEVWRKLIVDGRETDEACRIEGLTGQYGRTVCKPDVVAHVSMTELGASYPACAYCADGSRAPADKPQAAAVKPPKSAAFTPAKGPGFAWSNGAFRIDGLREVAADPTGARRAERAVAARVAEARAFIASAPKPRRTSAARTDCEPGTRRPYVRVMAAGAKSVTVNLYGTSETFTSMSQAARKIARAVAGAEQCARYVELVDIRQKWPNARVHIQADLDAGRLPAGSVIFSDSPVAQAA